MLRFFSRVINAHSLSVITKLVGCRVIIDRSSLTANINKSAYLHLYIMQCMVANTPIRRLFRLFSRYRQLRNLCCEIWHVLHIYHALFSGIYEGCFLSKVCWCVLFPSLRLRRNEFLRHWPASFAYILAPISAL